MGKCNALRTRCLWNGEKNHTLWTIVAYYINLNDLFLSTKFWFGRKTVSLFTLLIEHMDHIMLEYLYVHDDNSKCNNHFTYLNIYLSRKTNDSDAISHMHGVRRCSYVFEGMHVFANCYCYHMCNLKCMQMWLSFE